MHVEDAAVDQIEYVSCNDGTDGKYTPAIRISGLISKERKFIDILEGQAVYSKRINNL